MEAFVYCPSLKSYYVIVISSSIITVNLFAIQKQQFVTISHGRSPENICSSTWRPIINYTKKFQHNTTKIQPKTCRYHCDG